MKTKFDHAWLYLLKNEGGFVNDKKDRGGPTKYGVSLKFLKGLLNEEADNDELKKKLIASITQG